MLGGVNRLAAWTAAVCIAGCGPVEPLAAPEVPLVDASGQPEKSEQVPSPSSCDRSGLEGVGCDASRRCAGQDVEDEVVGLEEFLCLAHGSSSSGESVPLQAVLAQTPASFRKNFTAKHGVPRPGERGHAYELLEDFLSSEIVDTGQSATPMSPRTLMWDEQTGFSISFNGDAPGQTGGARLDLMRFDRGRDAFELWALDLPIRAPVQPYRPHTPSDDCAHCHGPHARPIWPMYPDWPGFFGSDNDELTSDSVAARVESPLWERFVRCVVRKQSAPECDGETSRTDHRGRFAGLVGQGLEQRLRQVWPVVEPSAIADYVAAHPRNLPGEDPMPDPGDTDAVLDWLGLRMHAAFPYRPDHAERSATPSRAFFHRPNLRLGVLYNRLLVRSVMARLREDPVFEPYQRFVALTVMDCGWGPDTQARAEIQRRFGAAVAGRLEPLGLEIGPDTDVRQPLLLAALGSSVREVDMRFSHSNPAYAPLDATAAAPLADGPMDLGFIAYAERDPYAVGASSRYFNSYFDGTATFDELWAAAMLDALARDDEGLAAVYEPNSLTRKYTRFTPRMALDAPFFAQMDALGRWMPLPYPRQLRPIHDREPFYKRKGGRARFIEPYLAVCTELRRGLRSQAETQP